MNKAEQLFEDFTGREYDSEFTISLKQLKELTFLGVAIALEYSIKKDREGDRHPEIYRHEFETPCILLTNGKDLIVYGEKLKVIDRGIIN
jgi:hypothetical protein